MPNSTDRLLLVVLAASLGLNVYLGVQLQKVPKPETSLQGRTISVGEKVPVFRAQRVGGSEELISFPHSQPTLLYVMSPTCKWCDRNAVNMASLYDQKKGELRFIALTLSSAGIEDYIAKHKMDYPVYQDIPPSVLKTMRFGSTPQTVLIDPNGSVAKNWLGAFGGETQAEVETTLRVRLPGITRLTSPEIVSRLSSK